MRVSRIASVLALVVATLATPASAQPKNPQAAARAEGEAGLALFEKQSYQEAFTHFEAADKLFHAPTLVLYMARCQDKMNHLVEARGYYELVVNEEVPKNAPKQFTDAQDAAKAELAAIKARIAKAKVTVRGAAVPEATRDGAPLRLSPTAGNPPVATAEVELSPGSHTFNASGDGRTTTATVTFEDGSVKEVSLDLAAPVTGPAPPVEVKRGTLIPAAVAFGVGGAALAVGAITGVVSLSKTSDLKSRCVGGHCPLADAQEATTARSFATVSTIGFIVGGAAVAAGVVLVVVKPKVTTKAESASIDLIVAPSSIGIAGRF